MSPEQIQLAFEAGRITIWQWDIAARRMLVHPLSANFPKEPRAARWGSRREFFDSVHPEDRARVEAAFGRSLATGANFESAFRIAVPDGQVRWLGVRAGVRRDESGNPLEMSGISIDITEQRNREIEIARREQSFSTLIDSLNSIIWEADAKTFKFLFASRQAERLLGYPLEDWYQPGFWPAHVHPDDVERCLELCRSHVARQEDHNFEYRMIAADGRIVWLHDFCTIQRGPDGPVRLRGIKVDITARKLAEQAHRESEALLELLFDQSPAGLVIFDTSAARVRVNAAYCRFVGRTQAEVMSTDFLQRIHPEDHERARQLVSELDQGRPVDAELRFLRPDGEIVWGRFLASRTSLDGRLYKGLSIVEDITAQKRSEALLKESSETFRSIANDTPVFLWMSSPEGKSVFINRAIADYHGFNGIAFDGDPLQHYHPDDYAAARADIEQAVSNRSAGLHACRIRRADGVYRWIENRFVPRFSDSGEFLGHVGAAFDVTERKLAEQELQSANDRLAAELRERALLQEELSNLSERLITAQEEERRRVARELHDSVGNQIAAMSLSLSAATRNSQPPDTPALAKMLSDMAQTIRGISHHLHPVILEYAGLAPALRGLCNEFSKLTSVQVSVVEPSDLGPLSPETTLCAYRVVQEALQNVAKHSGVTSAVVSVVREGDRLRLTICDRGVGFDPAEKHSGLGLISMRERVRLVKGTLEIDSRPGEGTTISVTAPC